MLNGAENRFKAKTIVKSDIYTDHPKNNTMIKLSLSVIHYS